MTQVMIKFAPQHIMMEMYRQDTTTMLEVVRQALADRTYTNSDTFEVEGSELGAADEVFDLTNNPSRQDEREQVYGRGRSLSVGDVVVAGRDRFLCMSFGWAKL